ncbi:acetyltransferase [Dyadobacter beijingensis]|uniref:Acetyltransferase n=1 Tax=Dyadobacter beijingensis TaxID=365489 RepID=A0ABQ2IHF1_9BACT|nr:GNAT family N-acetyltransferase [Dyadobacter beijingensis]GGN11606.1 acetyltransferase [Dyadobacter beijingensis]
MANTTIIRTMLASDIPFGMQLVQQAGWNQLEADWNRALALHPEGCFVAERGNIPAGTVTTCYFGSVAWIAMVLVDTAARNQGIGQKLMEHALAHLDSLGIETQRLDATVFGKGLYEKLGFAEEYEVVRMKGIAKAPGSLGDEAVRWSAHTPAAPLFGLDYRVTATRREAFLQSLAHDNTFYYSLLEDGLAYAGSRKGRNAVQIGPAIAATPEAGRQLCDAMLHHYDGLPVFVDIPVANKAAMRWAKANGLEEQRRFVRMFKGKKLNDIPESIWASSGPEKG